MRRCSDIQTGYAVQSNPCAAVTGGVMVPTPGKNILFCPDTPHGTIFSPSFTVVPGQVVLIDAYNMPQDYHIFVNRIVKSNFGPMAGDNCDPCAFDHAFGSDGKITFRERMTLGGSNEHWSLIKRADVSQSRLQLMIAVPGIYELELEEADMLGTMEVEYLAWDAIILPYLPKEYFAGIMNTVIATGA